MNLLQRLSLEYPIFLAPMAGVSTPELAAQVSNAGGLGSLGLGASSPAQARELIKRTQALTKRAFQVNFFCHQPQDYDPVQAERWIRYMLPYFYEFSAEPPSELKKIYPSFVDDFSLLEVLLETRPKAVSFHFGLPTRVQLQAIQQAGIISMVTITQLSEARLAKQAGIDVLIAQGVEAGGHRGMFNASCDPAFSTMDLVKLLKQHTDLPIVAAGGIMTGQDIRAYLEAGAQAAQLGTAFVQCAESAASEDYRTALFANPITQISDSLSGRPARGLSNQWHLLVDHATRPKHGGYPYSYDLAKQLHQLALKYGESGFAAHWAGANVAQIRRLDAQDLVAKLAQELMAID